MKTTILALVLAVGLALPAAAQIGGLVNVKSSHDVATTADRLESALLEKGITVFARIDHAAGAQKIGQELKPTLLIIFGSPAMGTPLMQRSRTMGIDLPLKALIWEDKAGTVWVTYNEPDYLVRRHGIIEMTDLIQQMGQAQANFTQAATSP